MPVPGFQDFMLPLLQLASNGAEHKLADCYDPMADHFALSEEDRHDLLPSGKKTRLVDRVQWANTYLRQAGLLASTRRGHFRITDRGRSCLDSGIDRIDVNYLRQFPELTAFLTRRKDTDDTGSESRTPVVSADLPDTPEEQLESIHNELTETLATELLELVMESSPRFFEELVVELLVAMGYGGSRSDAGQAVGRGGDGGVDGVIAEDRLGLDSVYIQAKRWADTVGRPTIQAFAGSLEGFRARKGVLITTSDFSRDARDFVQRIEKRIVLINGKQLARSLHDRVQRWREY